MAKISSKRRSFQIRQRKKKRAKLRRLRKLYTEAKAESERRKILDKALRVNPFFTKKEFLACLEKE